MSHRRQRHPTDVRVHKPNGDAITPGARGPGSPVKVWVLKLNGKAIAPGAKSPGLCRTPGGTLFAPHLPKSPIRREPRGSLKDKILIHASTGRLPPIQDSRAKKANLVGIPSKLVTTPATRASNGKLKSKGNLAINSDPRLRRSVKPVLSYSDSEHDGEDTNTASESYHAALDSPIENDSFFQRWRCRDVPIYPDPRVSTAEKKPSHDGRSPREERGRQRPRRVSLASTASSETLPCAHRRNPASLFMESTSELEHVDSSEAGSAPVTTLVTWNARRRPSRSSMGDAKDYVVRDGDWVVDWVELARQIGREMQVAR